MDGLSTIVLLFEKGFIQQLDVKIGESIKMGQRIATSNANNDKINRMQVLNN